ERPRAELAASLVKGDDLGRAEEIDHPRAKVDRLLDDEIVGAAERRLDVRLPRLGTQEVVLPPVLAVRAVQGRQTVDRAAERRAGIARRGRNEHAAKRRVAQQPVVRAAVEAGAAGEADILRPGARVKPARDVEQRFLERALT